jgi:predicted phage tail protein
MKAYQVFMTRETGDNRVRDAKQTMEKRPRKNNGKTEVPQSRRNMSLCVVFALMALGIVFNACKKDELADFPSPPTGVTANAQSSSSIRVSWQPVSNATSYEVYYEIGNSTNKIYAGTTSSTSYTHSGLQANTTYYYCIKSVNSSGSSNYSSYASATTIGYR